jgi:hypothetical protein
MKINRLMRKGIMGTELVVGLALLMLMAGLAAKGVFDYRRSCDTAIVRRAAIWAAEGQMRRLHAGAAFDSQPPAGTLADYIKVVTQAEPAGGMWAGFHRVIVTVTAEPGWCAPVHEQVVGYVRGGRS